MKVNLICVGKTEFNHVSEGIEIYRKRMSKYIQFEIIYLRDIKKTKSLSVKETKLKEGALILDKLKKEEINILLDEGGKQHSSVEFARYLQNILVNSSKNINFVIGGAYGFSDDVYSFVNNKSISLSKMTFSHQIIRVIFMEQLYRAMSIINNEPYHHQ